MIKKKAMICGVSGQDGAYLSKLLIEKGYEIIGTSRNIDNSNFNNLKHLNIMSKINIFRLNIENQEKVIEFIDKKRPNEIYNLSG